MGVYLSTEVEFGKADWLVKHHGAQLVEPVEPSLIDPDQALVIVLDYSPSHEAAGYVFNDQEFVSFAETARDPARRTRWLVMNRERMMGLIRGRDLMELQDVHGGGRS